MVYELVLASILIHYFQLIHRAYRTETDDVYES